MSSDHQRAILAVVLSALILFGWQYFYGSQFDGGLISPVNESIVKENTSSVKSSKSPVVEEVENSDVVPVVELQTFTMTNGEVSYELSNQLSIVSASAISSKILLNDLFEADNFFQVQFNFSSEYQNLFFNIDNVSDLEVNISNSEYGINGKILLNDDATLSFSLNSDKSFKHRFVYKSKEYQKSFQNLRQFVYYDTSFNDIEISKSKKGDSNVSWFGLDYNYHLFATILENKTNYLFTTTEEGTFTLFKSEGSNNLSFNQIFIQKEYDLLASYGYQLQNAVDFGIWSIIAVPILRGLQFFYTIFPNYGISIILLTLLIRLLTFPLQYKSFKSMKKMQIVQPELKELREKYKDNPQKMQQETMAVFKKAGANPLGGCLPMILQMPIFFAFYQVLYSAVELMSAPFYGWIIDLSEKDPYYILPALMALAMFLQQKLTPMTVSADPMQKKIMLFMPLVFGLIMKDLPSGLSLYIFTSTIFGMAQQLFVYKRVS